ncbi:MAG TPA: hypothetical protein VF256_02705 [Streptosporangiaceae bacterium]
MEIMECGCQEAADRLTGPAAALTLAASASPGLVIAGPGLPDADPAAAFAAADVTHRLSPPRRHR